MKNNGDAHLPIHVSRCASPPFLFGLAPNVRPTARSLAHGAHPYAGLDERQRADAADLDLLVGVVGILADEFHIPFALGLLDVLHRNVLLAVDIDRQQVHVAPKNVADIVQLFVEYDVAAFEQRIHRISHDVDRAVAFGQVGDMDEINGFELHLIVEERHEPRRPFDRVERHALQRQRVVRAVQVGSQVGLWPIEGIFPAICLPMVSTFVSRP